MECLSSRREREAPGGRAKIENSSRRHPRKFGQKRCLAVRRPWRGNGVACFGPPPWEKIFGGVIAISYPFGQGNETPSSEPGAIVPVSGCLPGLHPDTLALV